MIMRNFDLTPDPNVLIALTQTPLRQMDALCELVDNAIDSFSSAALQGIAIENPTVNIFLPKESEVKRGLGCVRIVDNGPGLSLDAAEKALRAGYSSNNQYDNLGLFGMGFNISTGKLGSITTLTTARPDANAGLSVTIDLNEMNHQKSYTVIPKEVEKPFEHGTEVLIRGWWPEGNSNNGFIRGLAKYSINRVTEELGRRYATLLRNQKTRIIVNGVECEPYEFCVWGANRHVIRKKYGEIPARYNIDKVIFTQRKCSKCGTMLESFQSECPSCGCAEIMTLEEHIHGWLGIQRYDSATEFGVDLIRNGRAIRIAEKSAFFDYTDEFNKTIHDYPIDGPFGRIVGEIHLDHVPVDFLKRDFQRSTPEWQRAMSFLRGDSSLQPTQKDADKNQSYMFKLFQGYRKVRTAGTTDMYMGYWDVSSNSPKRIPRSTEEEFIQKFKEKVPGYVTDEKWWEKVEEADYAPLPEIPTCPECGIQVHDGAEICNGCGHILKGKTCIKCEKIIAKSAKSCPYCGAAQEAEILKPWKCNICGKLNAAHAKTCINCGQPKDVINTLALDYLKSHSNRDDDYSIENCSIKMPDGSASNPLKINVYTMSEKIISNITKEEYPIYVYRNEIGALDVFVDRCHKIFNNYQAIPELLIATEIADRIRILNGAGHDIEGIEGIANIAWQIVGKYWHSELEKNAEKTTASIRDFFSIVKKRLAMSIGPESSTYYNELTDAQSKVMAMNIINAGIDISSVNSMKENGDFLLYVSDDFIIRLFELNPGLFFDSKVWDEKYEGIDAPPDMKLISQNQIRVQYKICLEDIFSFIKMGLTDTTFIRRTGCSLDYLNRKVITDVY